MTIKELAYSTQQHLQASTKVIFKRAHIYELLASSFGFNSYAAFGVAAVFTRRRSDRKRESQDKAAIRQRCVDLGYQAHTADLASSALLAFLAENQMAAMRISDLVDDYLEEDVDESESVAPITLEGLELAAGKGIALAHYALALIHASSEEDEEEGAGRDYWYTQRKQGRVLTGIEEEWANAHAARLQKAAKYAHHLREAARLGQHEALLDLADQFDDPAFFEVPDANVNADPAFIAEIADRLGRPDDVKKWLTIAAQAGDIEAMRQLIEEYDHGDLQKCWMWVYLAELIGEDLTEDRHYAIHDDGSLYDDDVGGNAFVAGRDGIKLEPLNDELDAIARSAAKRIFSNIE